MIEPNNNDVLCGRGKGSYRHKGNIIFRELVNSYKKEYVSCKKGEKRNIALTIVNTIRSQDPPGRFLELDPRLGSWVEVLGDERAIEKTCQTLRKGNTNKPFQTLRKELNNIDSNKPKQGSQLNYFGAKNNVFLTHLPQNYNKFSSTKDPYSTIHQVPKHEQWGMLERSFTTSFTKKDPEINLSVYNGLILANLKKYYYSEKNCSFLVDGVCQSKGKIDTTFQDEKMNNYYATNNNSHCYCFENDDNCDYEFDEFLSLGDEQKGNQIDNECDDDILMAIMNIDQDNTTKKCL